MSSASCLHLSFERSRDNTVLRIKSQEPPWRVVRGFETTTGETLAHLHNMSGGILDTDHLEWRIDVEPNAQAQVTSLSAERDDLSAKPQAAAKNSPEANPVAAPAPIVSAPISTKPATAHERDMPEESEAKPHYIDYLRQTNSEQAKELATLRAELETAKNAAKSTSPDVASAVK